MSSFHHMTLWETAVIRTERSQHFSRMFQLSSGHKWRKCAIHRLEVKGCPPILHLHHCVTATKNFQHQLGGTVPCQATGTTSESPAHPDSTHGEVLQPMPRISVLCHSIFTFTLMMAEAFSQNVAKSFKLVTENIISIYRIALSKSVSKMIKFLGSM